MFRLFVSLILILGTACTKTPVEKKKIGTVEKQDVIQKVTLNGTVRGLRQSLIQAGYNGYVGKLYVAVGDEVKENQPLMILEAMKMENEVVANHAGKVAGIHVNQGQVVNAGDALITIA